MTRFMEKTISITFMIFLLGASLNIIALKPADATTATLASGDTIDIAITNNTFDGTNYRIEGTVYFQKISTTTASQAIGLTIEINNGPATQVQTNPPLPYRNTTTGIFSTSGQASPGDTGSLTFTAVDSTSQATAKITFPFAYQETPKLSQSQAIQADLSVSITDTPDPVTAGGMVAYEITIKNNGPGAAKNVVIKDKIIGDASNFVPPTAPSTADCSTPTDNMVCQLGDLAPGDAVSITTNIQLTPSARGTITYVVTAISDTPDPTTPNEATQTTQIIQTQQVQNIRIMPTVASQTISKGSSAKVTLKIQAPSGFNSDFTIIAKPMQQSKYLALELHPPINVYDTNLNGYRDVTITITPSRDAFQGEVSIVLDAMYVDPSTEKEIVLEDVGRITIIIKEEEIGLQKEPTLKITFVLGEVLVILKDSVDPKSTEVQSVIAQVRGQIVEVIDEINAIRISVPKGTEERTVGELQKSDIVKVADKNKYLVPVSIDIGDPDFPKQVKHYEMINLPNAWSMNMGRSEVIVAVLDSGVDIEHPDLEPNIWTNDDDCNNDLDDDENGSKDDCNGWNFADSNNEIMDDGGSWPECDGHGTHVAGIIGAMSNNAGGVGVAPHVTIMPIKVSGNENIEGDIVCVSDEAKVAKAVIYAVDNGAKIINASLGCPNGEKCVMSTLGVAFEYAYSKGVLVVVAAGNEKGIDDWQDYAQYIIEVSSIDMSGELAKYSNFGRGIELTAPGTTVYSTKIDGRYGIKTGTSQASPMVAGCAALILSANPSLTNIELEKILNDNAKDVGKSGKDDSFGYGLLDCGKALKSAGTLTIHQEGSLSIAMKHKKKVTLVSVKNGDDEPVYGFELKIMQGSIKFVKARNWDRDRIDQSTVIVQTKDRPIKLGGSLIILLVVDNRNSDFGWKGLDLTSGLIASGIAIPR